MIEIQTKNLHNILGLFQKVSGEVTLIANQSGFSIQAKGHASMIQFDYKTNCNEEWEEKVFLKDLMLAIGKKEDRFVILKQQATLNIARGIGFGEFEIPFIDIGQAPDTKLPNITPENRCTIRVKDLYDSISDLSKIDKSIRFEANDNIILYASQNTKKGSIQIEVNYTEKSDKINARYDADILLDLINTSVSESGILSYHTDHPLKFEYVELNAKLWFIVAPLVDNN